jgi:hypothetical protein
MNLMRILLVISIALAGTARTSEACVQFAETNRLLGWSADGSLALHARIVAGTVEHAELLPTRYEGHKYVIRPVAGSVEVRAQPVASCQEWHAAKLVERVPGTLTESSLRALATVTAIQLVAPPAARSRTHWFPERVWWAPRIPLPPPDGGASRLGARFVPDKRYAEHELEIRDDAGDLVTTLTVPVWCVGSCHRDEVWRDWGASITTVASAGGRTLYVVRMRRVCNGGNDNELWIERVIAERGGEARPARDRCRGSG